MHSTWELPHFYSMEMLRDSVIRVFSLSLSFIDDFWNIFFYFFPPIPSEEFLLIFPTSLSYCYLRMKMEMKKLLISRKVHFRLFIRREERRLKGKVFRSKRQQFSVIDVEANFFFFPLLFVSLLLPYIPVSKLHRHVTQPRMTAYFALLFARLVCL